MPDAMAVDGGVHKIYLNGVYVGSGESNESNESNEIARLSDATQTVTVHLRNLSMARLIRFVRVEPVSGLWRIMNC